VAFIQVAVKPFCPNDKKLELEPILTKYTSISSSGHLEDAYASENCLKRWDHGKKVFKSLFTFLPKCLKCKQTK
jgi:hypothetical protein